MESVEAEGPGAVSVAAAAVAPTVDVPSCWWACRVARSAAAIAMAAADWIPEVVGGGGHREGDGVDAAEVAEEAAEATEVEEVAKAAEVPAVEEAGAGDAILILAPGTNK